MSAACSVSIGDYPLSFSWYFNDKTLMFEDRQDISISTSKRRSYLEIDSVNAEHAGEYTCTVSNEAGAVSHSTVLVVNGKFLA